MADAGSDLQLLFGVLGGVGFDKGSSGELIKRQLEAIISEINKNPLKVKVGIDTNAGGKKSWSGQLQEKLNQISQSGKFSVQISSLKLSAGAISDFKKQLGAIVNTLGLSTGTEITISSKGIGEIKKDLQDAGAAATDATRKIAEFKVQMEALGGQKNSIKKSIDDLTKTATSDDERARIAEITAQYEQWAVKIEEIRASKSAVTGEYRTQIEAEGAAIRSNSESINQERAAVEETVRVQREAAQATEDAAKQEEAANREKAAAQEKKNSALRTGIQLLGRMEKAERDWTAAQNGSSKDHYKSIQEYIKDLERLNQRLRDDKISIVEYRKKLRELQKSFSESSNAIKGAGENTKTLSARLGGLAQKFSAWLSVSQVIMLGVRSIRRMVSATIELDDAMTQLKVVTQETSRAYDEYLEKISNTAARIGADIPDLIDSTTTYARLGYSLDESSKLAEYTSMLQNVGDIDVSDAQNAITAIIKAFGVSVDEIESTMDKLVITGNNFPISVSQIAEGMNNASSALAAAGNTFEESVALLTAANTTIQNAAKSSTGLRTVAARLRDTKTELDELGEAMTEAEYGELVAALTKYNVALTDATGEFRSTYDVVADIAAIWENLTSMEQAALANAIAGVRQQSVFYSMVEQFQEASGAMESMANSAGTLTSSYAVFLESITSHINEFKAAFQSLGRTAFSTDFLKEFIDFGTNVLGVLEAVVKLINVVGGLNTVLTTTLGIMIATNKVSIYDRLSKMIGPITKIAKSIATATANGQTFGAAMAAAFAKATAGANAFQIAIGAVGVALVVIPIVVNLVKRLHDALTVTAEEAREAADELRSAFEETASVLNDLNSELETSKSRLKELEKLSDTGTITLVEQEELRNLREEIALMERRKAILEEQAKNDGEKADAALVAAFEKKRFDSSSKDYFTAEMESLLEEKRKLLADVEDNWDADAQSRLDQIEGRIRDLNSVVYNDDNAGSDKKLGFEDRIDELIRIYEMLDKIEPANMSDSALKLFEETREELVDIASELDTDWIDELAVDSEVKDSWQDLFDRIDKCINPAKYFTKALSSLSDAPKKQLENLGKSGELTADRVEKLAQSFPELKAWMEESGYTAEETASHFNALSVSSQDAASAQEEAAVSLTETLSALDTISKNIETVSKAFGEFSEEGRASVSTLSGMSDELKGLSSFENLVNVLSDSESAMEDVQDACSRLVREYIETSGILDDLNESNAKLIETQLEEMGVTNAHALVQEKLTAAKYEAMIAEASFSDASERGAEALLKNAGASETVIAALKRLRQEQYNARLATIDLTTATSSNIEALIQQARAAGVASKSISALSTLKNLAERGYDYYKSSGLTQKGYEALLENAKRAAQVDVSDLGEIVLPKVTVSLPKGSLKGSSKSSGTSSKEIEDYIADIDKYREATERLRKAQESRTAADRRISDTKDVRQRILLERQLIGAYRNESATLKTLSNLRSDTISANVEKLRELGFEVRHNAEANEFWVSNLDHLNELTAVSKGKYDSLRDATNALRKETEGLIDATSSLNEENRESTDSIYELGTSIYNTKLKIIEDLKGIVATASEAVDEIQNVYSILKTAADEYAENGGFISVDVFQDIIALGPQYMQYLRDENDLLVINEENINKVIIAKTRQLAAEQALTYVERLRLALEEGSIENLNTLLYATTDATDATFGLAYAQLELMHAMGDLDDRQYAAALHNIQSIESLANTAIASVGQVAEESGEKLKEKLENMKSGIDDILKYVMDMLKHEIQQQIDALEDMKDAYGEIVDLRKEALDAAKREADYEDKVAEKVKKIAKLQERINALSLDDSRDAQAQKLKLEEEMAELQKELSDDQNDHAVDAQKEALDNMKEAYDDEKDAEIATLEETISSYQKLYDMAIDYIESHWNTLYDELIAWNTEYGSVLNSEITEAWNNCLAAAQRYGSYVSALNSIDADIETANKGSGSTEAPSNNTIVGNSNHSSASNEDAVHAIIRQMYSNMNEHGGSGSSTSPERKSELSKRNLQLGAQLHKYGINAYRSTDKEDLGTWYTDSSKRELLFEKYKKYIYHKGGIVGDAPTLKQNEIMAVLEKGEAVLDKKREESLYRGIEFVTTLLNKSEKLCKLIGSADVSRILTGARSSLTDIAGAASSFTNKDIRIEFNGDTYITGTNEETIEKHHEINRQFTNEILKTLNIKR